MPNTQEGMKFVERTEMAIMQFVILSKAQQGEVTRENLQQTFRGNLQMGDHLDHCLDLLVQERHLKEVGGSKYTITDDGREDVQKLQNLFVEIPNVVQQGGGQQQKQGMTQQRNVGGGSTGTTGGTMGGQGTMGSSSRQGSDIGSNQPTTSGGNTLNKGGATQPAGNKGNTGNPR